MHYGSHQFVSELGTEPCTSIRQGAQPGQVHLHGDDGPEGRDQVPGGNAVCAVDPEVLEPGGSGSRPLVEGEV